MLAGNDEERVGSDCTVVWRDDAFFTQFPLNLDTVLDYFALSPFYVPGCRNDEAKRQGVPLEALRCCRRPCQPSPASSVRRPSAVVRWAARPLQSRVADALGPSKAEARCTWVAAR